MLRGGVTLAVRLFALPCAFTAAEDGPSGPSCTKFVPSCWTARFGRRSLHATRAWQRHDASQAGDAARGWFETGIGQRVRGHRTLLVHHRLPVQQRQHAHDDSSMGLLLVGWTDHLICTGGGKGQAASFLFRHAAPCHCCVLFAAYVEHGA